jgi:hypothetical protein
MDEVAHKILEFGPRKSFILEHRTDLVNIRKGETYWKDLLGIRLSQLKRWRYHNVLELAGRKCCKEQEYLTMSRRYQPFTTALGEVEHSQLWVRRPLSVHRKLPFVASSLHWVAPCSTDGAPDVIEPCCWLPYAVSLHRDRDAPFTSSNSAAAVFVGARNNARADMRVEPC